MTIVIHYGGNGDRAARPPRTAREILAVAAQLRRQLASAGVGINDAHELMAALPHVEVNARPIDIIWDADHAVHDNRGVQVLGVCETDLDNPGGAYVSINGPLLGGRPDLMLSTVAHELGHVIFDVPADHRHYRAVTPSAASLASAACSSEWRANEFMGALLVPAYELHRQLLSHARAEGLHLVRAPHQGRPGCPIVDGRSDAEALAGVVAALAIHFGVSDSFIRVRLRRYGLVTAMKEIR